LTFGGGGGEKFVALDNNETERGICVGGPTPGENCDPANGNLTDPENAGAKCDDGGRGGSCAELESKSTAVGWQGLCLDYDQSISVNGDPNKFACNLWMPVDQIAGAQDVFNQFRSAGFDVDSPLVYCAASAGGKGNIVSTSCAPIAGTETPYADVIHNESCANITTLLDDNTEIGHLNDQYWFFSPSVGSFSRRHTEPVGVAERDIVGVKIEFIDHAMPRGVKNAEDVVRPFATAYLFPSSDNAKDWKRTVSWTTNDRSSGSPKLGIGNAIIDPSNGSVLGDSVPDAQCMSLLDMSNSDGESECDKINDNKICIAMRGNTQNGQLNSIHAAFCDAGRGGGGAKRHFVRVQVTLLRREACTVLSNVHLGATDDFASAPWTDRLLNDNATDLPGFITSSGGKYNREDVTSRPNVSSDITPFGHGQTNGDISAIAGKQTFPVFGTEGGSNFTTVTISGGDYLEQSGNTNAGYTYACDGGGCDQIGTTSGGFDATKAAGENRLKELFAVSWFNFEAASGQTYTKVGTATTPAWDHRKDFNTPDVAPQVRGVDIFNCLADGGCLERAQPGITINSTSTGSVEGEGGRLKATIRYYGYANKDHMPIRRLMIDFDGNGHTAAGQSKVIATSGFYRNHRGVKEVQGKLTPICGATETEWGKTPQSCDTFFFEQTKTYLCSNALLEQLPLCGTAGYPCRRADTCVYKPKVQIMDNWAMCNGNCGGEACMNTKLGVDDIAGCDKLNPNAWTPFAGEVIVRP
jgi:hypothetical protein